MAISKQIDDELFESYQEVGTTREQFDYLIRAWSDKRKHSELSDYRRERAKLEQRQAKIVEAVRFQKLVRSIQPEKDTTLVRVRVKLTGQQWHYLEVQALPDSESFTVEKQIFTTPIFEEDDSGETVQQGYDYYIAGGIVLREDGLGDHVSQGMDEDILRDFEKHQSRISAVGYPPVSAVISKIVYPAMRAKLNIYPAPRVVGLEEREIRLTAPEITYLRRRGPKKLSAVLRSLLDRHSMAEEKTPSEVRRLLQKYLRG